VYNWEHLHSSGIFTEAKEIQVKDMMFSPSFPRFKNTQIVRVQGSCRLVLVLVLRESCKYGLGLGLACN